MDLPNRLSLEQTKQLTNDFLNDYITQKIKQSDKLNRRYGLLWRSVSKLVETGGKRFRPYMSILAYQAFSGKDASSIIPIVSSQELLHLSLLIHDDIIDRDLVRYGIDNISGQYQKTYSEFVHNTEELDHYSDSAALLAGDLLISSSYELLVTNSPNDKIKELVKVFEEAIFFVAGGELLDTESAFISENIALTTNELKTAHYSFVAPLLIGAILAGADSKSKTTIKEVAILIGTAYQLVDDEIGLFGDQKITGKTNYGDISEGKKTFMIEQFNELANQNDKNEFEKYFGNRDLQHHEAVMARELIVKSGARQANSQKILSLKNQALDKINSMNIDDESKKSFTDLVLITLGRNS